MKLAETIRGLGNPRVVVLGDLILDHYVFGAVNRISPEAPIGVLRVGNEESRLGCAGAVARNLAVLGAEVTLCGYLGSGDFGKAFLFLAGEAGIGTKGIRHVSGRPTSRKTRLIAQRGAGGQQVLRVDREDVRPYPEEDAAALADAVLEAMSSADLVVLSDYAKGTLSPELIRMVINRGREQGIRVIIDPKPPGLQRYEGASALTPNRAEAEAHVGFPVRTPEDAARAANALLDDLALEAALVTLDRDGIYLAEHDGASGLFGVNPREVYDVTGAGDMVISALAMVLAAGGSYTDAVRMANLAAGVEVSHLGAVPVSREELLEALHKEAPAIGGKCLSLRELKEVIAARRSRGDQIVFTNGCFDVLHVGHIRLLNDARKEGDALVVALNSDASIKRLKGESRPVVPEAQRVETLSALASVDHVILFDGDTPLDIIEGLLPDILVKGEDWKDKGVVGREVVEAAGGRVVLVALTPGLSTTELIRRMSGEKE